VLLPMLDAPHHINRLALLGGESSGKTTLAQALAAALHTVWVPEYGRALWESLRRTLTVAELVQVAQQQIKDEDHLAHQARDWLICDTTPLTTLQYCLHDHGNAPAALREMAQRPYDLVVLCHADFDFVQDGCRRDDAFRAAQEAWTVAQLTQMGQAFVRVTGPAAARVQQVLRHIHPLHLPVSPETHS
jgi:HTH-type transcriptional regulator, transcriptional repressor of NAD biosynthesis genes